MPIEAALIKPVVDALMALFRRGENLHLKHNAEAALREAIRELLLANPDENKAEARIAIAKAAGILSGDVVLAEDMLRKHRATKSRTAGKSGRGGRARLLRSRRPSPAKAATKKAAKTAARKPARNDRDAAVHRAVPRVGGQPALDRAQALRGSGQARDRGTLGLLIAAIVGALALGVWLAWRDDGQLATNEPLLWTGMAVMVAGLLLRWWSVRTLAQYFTVDIAIQPGQELIRRGPYRRLRHPSYSGALLTVSGFGIALGNPLAALVVIVPITAAFLWRIRIEEQMLAQAFPEAYPDYARETWRLIPFLW